MTHEVERLREALKALFVEWYDRDGSVGAARVVFEEHREAISLPVQGVGDVRSAVIEECAKVADAYAEENQRIAGDTILHDPVLAGQPLSLASIVKSKSLMIDGCIHSSMFHAAQNIAGAIRALQTAPPPALQGAGDRKVWQDAPYGTSFGRYMENALSKLCAARDHFALAAAPHPPTERAPASCPHCRDTTDCEQVSLCNEIEKAYLPHPPRVTITEDDVAQRLVEFSNVFSWNGKPTNFAYETAKIMIALINAGRR